MLRAGQLTDGRFGSKADMCSAQADVRYVPIADMSLFNNFVGARKEG